METDLSVRYTLVDTIEDRNIGQVIEEGIGEEGLHVTVQVEGNRKEKESELYSLIKSLGLGNASFRLPIHPLLLRPIGAFGKNGTA